MGKEKLNLNYIGLEFKKEKYILLTLCYANKNQRLDYLCPNNHKHSVSWDNWKKGRRCPYCFGNAKPTIEYIRSMFEEENYTLLTNVYINNRQKLDYICPAGHRHSIIWNNWQNGNRCFKCALVDQSIRQTGVGNHQWKGGISCELYCDAWFDKEYKESIKERDGYKCLNPVCDSKSNRLNIHHINYDKKNCPPDNLITLCVSCNGKANFNRDWHSAWYKAIMYRRYKTEGN